MEWMEDIRKIWTCWGKSTSFVTRSQLSQVKEMIDAKISGGERERERVDKEWNL